MKIIEVSLIVFFILVVSGCRSKSFASQDLPKPEQPKKSKDSFRKSFENVKRNTTFIDDTNIGYLYSNEEGVDNTMTWLKSQKAYGDTFIGVACTFTLSAFSIRPESVDHLLAIDITAGTGRFWRDVEKVVLSEENRAEALKKFVSHFKNATEEASLDNQSFLSSDEQYAKVRKMFSEGKFTFIQADLTSEEVLEAVGKALKKEGHTVDSTYQSNIGRVSYAWKRLGWTGLNSRIREYLVRESLQKNSLKEYISIYAPDGANSSTTQKFFIEKVEPTP